MSATDTFYADDTSPSPGQPRSTSSKHLDLVKAQQGILSQIINLDTSASATNDSQAEDDPLDFDQCPKIAVGAGNDLVDRSMFTFKVLVYDSQVQSVMAPLFKVGNLRDCNVVLHSNITAKRENCPGLPVIYLVEPTLQNVEHIVSDLQQGLYDFVFVNFVSQVADNVLDQFALMVSKANCAHKICKVTSHNFGVYQVINRDFYTFFNHKANFINLYQNKHVKSTV